MNNTVLSVNNVGKVFRRYRHELYRILRWFSINAPVDQETWVLRNISFDVEAGQALAIVGRNGAGKSTLLKLITGTMRATEGTIYISGSVSAILELGMGFNPDFSGRQNVLHALGMMGHSHQDITAAIPDIQEFSELGEYFDQPLRIYSSGMHMRLAFSVATAFRPDLLIVDEALSVGDSYFQHKSFERIREYRKKGTTLIIVSHDRMALLSLCDRAILLNDGYVALDGDPESILDYYNALLSEKIDPQIRQTTLGNGRVQTTSGSAKVIIDKIEVLNAAGAAVESVNVGDRLTVKVRVVAKYDVPQLILGFAIKDRFGQTMFGTNTYFSQQQIVDVRQGDIFMLNVTFDVNLGPGSYSVALALVGGEDHLEENYEWRDLAAVFTVINLSKQTFDGKVFLPSEFSILKADSSEIGRI